MPAPATTGQLRTNISDMEIGDYIQVNWTAPGVYAIGTGGKPECPITGLKYDTNKANTTSHLNHFFYFVKVTKGLLVCDRVWCHSVSWDTLNSGQQIQGHPATIDGNSGFIRSITGGVAYIDINGNPVLTDAGLGAFPSNNEWDKYISNFPANLIQDGKTIEDVFHFETMKTWVQEVPIIGFINVKGGASSTNASRLTRGHTTNTSKMVWSSYTLVATDTGFRPVFEYEEV